MSLGPSLNQRNMQLKKLYDLKSQLKLMYTTELLTALNMQAVGPPMLPTTMCIGEVLSSPNGSGKLIIIKRYYISPDVGLWDVKTICGEISRE